MSTAQTNCRASALAVAMVEEVWASLAIFTDSNVVPSASTTHTQW
jgi:hypothetical protein